MKSANESIEQKIEFRKSVNGIRLAISLLTNGDFPRYALPVHANSGMTLHKLDEWYRSNKQPEKG
jgi:hypothetical protein